MGIIETPDSVTYHHRRQRLLAVAHSLSAVIGCALLILPCCVLLWNGPILTRAVQTTLDGHAVLNPKTIFKGSIPSKPDLLHTLRPLHRNDTYRQHSTHRTELHTFPGGCKLIEKSQTQGEIVLSCIT